MTTDGTSDLESGVAELHDGTQELAGSTSDLPEELEREIDEMVSEYDKSDFDPVSFVSSKNENVETVQFVIKTESIKQEEAEEEESFWDRLLDLFMKQSSLYMLEGGCFCFGFVSGASFWCRFWFIIMIIRNSGVVG
ncbi:hypothetical protein [Virgibacillus sediminis]|uniref:Uncharacterized protein n=1 Tax=Virgibacillus sediminis TaxID=202260 RepID=A0ABV7A8N9_9BACI